MVTPLAFGLPGPEQMMFLAVIGLLFFGKRLPEVGRSLGKGIVEFKKGLKDLEGDATETVAAPTPQPPIVMPTARPEYKFDPYTGKPVETPGASTTPPTV